MRFLLRIALMFGAISMSFASSAREIDYQRTITRVARDIAKLKGDFPQLADFSLAQNLQAKELKISYGYHTHQAGRTGGWTSGVPNPDEDGVWFYIDFHDPGSTAQIHTQPMSAPICIGGKRVSFLSLEGARTSSLSGSIAKILKRHGATDCAH